MSLKIEMLPAAQGDALWIEYGPEPRRLLIDTGPRATAAAIEEKVASLSPGERAFELLVVSHIDSDHIGGSIPLLEAAAGLGLSFADVWFNGRRHLPTGGLEPFGPAEGDQLTTLIERGPWNKAWEGEAAVVPDEGDLPVKTLPGGLRLTLLSPYAEQLRRLLPNWPELVREHGLIAGVAPTAPPELGPGLEALGRKPPIAAAEIDCDALATSPFSADTSAPNGTSIVLLVEHEGASALLCADGYPKVIARSVERLSGSEKLRVGAFKLPHHGSRANLDLGLAERIAAKQLLVSTNGSKTNHPNPEAIARALRSGDRPELYLNYVSEWDEAWTEDAVARRCGYTPIFPNDPDRAGIVVEVASP